MRVKKHYLMPFLVVIALLSVVLFFGTTHAADNAALEKMQSDTQKKCAKEGKGVKTTVSEVGGKVIGKFGCSKGRGDICIYTDLSGKEKLCDPKAQQRLDEWAKDRSNDIASSLYDYTTSPEYPLSEKSTGIYFSDPYGIVSPLSAFEPELPDGGQRLVNITNDNGLDEALHGINGRVESFGMKLLEAGVPLDSVTAKDLGVDFTGKPFPNSPSDDITKPFDLYTFKQGGDSGLTVQHVISADNSYKLSEEYRSNPALRVEPSTPVYEGTLPPWAPAETAPKPVEIPNFREQQIEKAFSNPNEIKIYDEGKTAYRIDSPPPSSFYSRMVTTVSTAWRNFWHLFFP